MFRLKVCATNEIGVGPSSSSLVIHTKPLPPDAPDLSCIQYGYNCLKLKWNAGSKVVSGTQYLLQKISKKESGKKYVIFVHVVCCFAFLRSNTSWWFVSRKVAVGTKWSRVFVS